MLKYTAKTLNLVFQECEISHTVQRLFLKVSKIWERYERIKITCKKKIVRPDWNNWTTANFSFEIFVFPYVV